MNPITTATGRKIQSVTALRGGVHVAAILVDNDETTDTLLQVYGDQASREGAVKAISESDQRRAVR